jgi:hypothetical protein
VSDDHDGRAPQEVIDRLIAAAPDLAPELMTQLLAALRDKERLGEAITDLCWKATPYGGGESVSAYVLPAGTVHRLIGAAQGAGIPAAFRAFSGVDGDQ